MGRDEMHDDPDAAAGDILGISRVQPGGNDEISRPPEGEGNRSDDEDEERITPLEDSVNLGSRDVTNVGRGQTGPETGGHGSTPRRSGATGSDIGG